MTIKLELPANDPLVLNEMGLALTRIAAALNGNITTIVETTETVGDISHSVKESITSRVETLEDIVQPIDDEATSRVEKLIDSVSDELPAATVEQITQAEINAGNLETSTETVKTNAADVFGNTEQPNISADIGSDGVPWDKRIHSREKTKNKDLTFKIKRKTKEFETKEEWLAFVNTVKQELMTAMSATGNVEPIVENIAPPATTENVAPPIVENIAPPESTEVVAPPSTTEVVTPPIEQPLVDTFQKLMLLITTNSKKITKDQVNKIINDAFGTTATNPVALCATRTDLIPAIAAQIMVITNG